MNFFIIKKVKGNGVILVIAAHVGLTARRQPPLAPLAKDGSPIRGPYGPLSNGPYGSRPYGRREPAVISLNCYRLKWALYCPRSAMDAYNKLRKIESII